MGQEAQKSILIVGRKNTDNLGDRLISFAVGRLFGDLGAEVRTTELCGGEKATSGASARTEHSLPEGMKYILRRIAAPNTFLYGFLWRIKKKALFTPLKEKHYDVILIGGGELIQSNSIFPTAVNAWMKEIKKYQKNAVLVFFSVGVTRKFEKKEKKLFRRAIKAADIVYVRDENSRVNIKECFGTEARVIPDAVYYLKPSVGAFKRDKLMYGITSPERVIRYGMLAKSKDEYFENSAAELFGILKNTRGLTAELFGTSEADRKACGEFAVYFYKKYGISLQTAEIDSEDKLTEECGKTAILYSPRMHGCLVGVLCGCEVHPIPLSPKMLSCAENIREEKPAEENRNALKKAAKTVMALCDHS